LIKCIKLYYIKQPVIKIFKEKYPIVTIYLSYWLTLFITDSFISVLRKMEQFGINPIIVKTGIKLLDLSLYATVIMMLYIIFNNKRNKK